MSATSSLSAQQLAKSRQKALQMLDDYQKSKQYFDDHRAMTWEERKAFSGKDVQSDPRFQNMSPEEWRAARTFWDDFQDGFHQSLKIIDDPLAAATESIFGTEWRPLEQAAQAVKKVGEDIAKGDLTAAVQDAMKAPTAFLPEEKFTKAVITAATGDVGGALTDLGAAQTVNTVNDAVNKLFG